MTSLKISINKAKSFYFDTWRGHEKVCPAFRQIVFVTRLGWNHVVFNKRHRNKDVAMRLKYLYLAKELLELASTYQDVRKKGRDYYYGFDAIIKGKRIRVVVTSRGKFGKKIFLSIIYRP